MHEPAFSLAADRLLRYIDRHQLAPPLSIGWHGAAPHTEVHLRVQVDDSEFRQWVEHFTCPTYRTEAVGDATHVHVEDHVDGVAVHLVAVMHPEQQGAL